MSEKPQKPWWIITHFWSHFDEYVAIALLRKYGEAARLHGIRNAMILFDDAGSDVPECVAKKYWKDARLFPIGIWGAWGPANEHGDKDHARKHEECAASLTLKFLKSRIPDFDDPRAETLVAYATRIDLNGGATKPSLANIIKNMNWLGGQDQTLCWILHGILTYLDRGDPNDSSFELESVAALMPDGIAKTDWLLKGFEAINWETVTFQNAVETLRENKPVRNFTERTGGRRDLIAMESPNPMMGRAITAWAKANVAIVQKPSGHVVILTGAGNGHRTDLTGFVRVLNREELALRGDTRQWNFGELSREGTIPGSVWSFQPDLMCILNGSPSAPFIPATRIPFDRVVELALLSLDEIRFCTEAEGHACDGTHCDSRRNNPCPFFQYGLPRCQRIRQIQRYATPALSPEPVNAAALQELQTA